MLKMCICFNLEIVLGIYFKVYLYMCRGYICILRERVFNIELFIVVKN